MRAGTKLLRSRVASRTILEDWWKFIGANPTLDTTTLILGYVGQQISDGIDPSTILNRLKTLTSLGTPLDTYGYTRACAKLMFGSIQRELTKKKNRVGTKHRPLIHLSGLRRVYNTPSSSRRDTAFQLFFYLLVVTGQRAANLVDATFSYTSEGISVRFHQGRKNDKQGLRCSILFPFIWTEAPPAHLATLMKREFNAPSIGTPTSIASNINAWLKARGFSGITSAVPRTHLDNVLRVLLEKGLITEELFVRTMDHTIVTSDKHYFAL